MNLPFEYDRLALGEFCGTTPTTTDFDKARVVILPVPLDRTTSSWPDPQRAPRDPCGRRRNGALGRGNRDRRPPHREIFTLPDMDFPFATLDE